MVDPGSGHPQVGTLQPLVGPRRRPGRIWGRLRLFGLRRLVQRRLLDIRVEVGVVGGRAGRSAGLPTVNLTTDGTGHDSSRRVAGDEVDAMAAAARRPAGGREGAAAPLARVGAAAGGRGHAAGGVGGFGECAFPPGDPPPSRGRRAGRWGQRSRRGRPRMRRGGIANDGNSVEGRGDCEICAR